MAQALSAHSRSESFSLPSPPDDDSVRMTDNDNESVLLALHNVDDDSIMMTDNSNNIRHDSEVEEYNSEIMRLLSYPDNVPYSVSSPLAKKGFYFSTDIGVARCQFCGDTIIDVTETVQHSCRGNRSNNQPTPNDVSNYRYESNRILSFLTVDWNKMVEPGSKHFVGALDLAKEGFYYTGVRDAARCVFCRLEVRGWEEGDNADSEHRRWNPNCPFLNGRPVGNVKLGHEVQEVNIAQDAVNMATPTSTHSHYIIPAKDNCDVITDESLGVHKIHTSRHPEYSSVSSRRASYNMWPLSLRQRPAELSEAGFFYTGKGDRVICFQCGGGLKDWGNQDEPWVEHAVWFPRCVYLNLNKTLEFIQRVQMIKNQHLSGDFDMSLITNDSFRFRQSESSSPVSAPAAVSADKPPVTPAKTREYIFPAAVSADKPPVTPAKTPTGEEVPSHRQCKVCMDKELGIVFLPCGHMAACVDCAPQLKCCPVCRGELTAYVRAFLP